jgi:hypothetical protein
VGRLQAFINNITWEQMAGVVSRLAMFLAGYLGTHGWLTDEQQYLFASAIVSLSALGWSLWKNRPTGLVKAAARLPQVETVMVNSPTMAANTPNNVVVTR